jgi:hypothetical protein
MVDGIYSSFESDSAISGAYPSSSAIFSIIVMKKPDVFWW